MDINACPVHLVDILKGFSFSVPTQFCVMTAFNRLCTICTSTEVEHLYNLLDSLNMMVSMLLQKHICRLISFFNFVHFLNYTSNIFHLYFDLRGSVFVSVVSFSESDDPLLQRYRVSIFVNIPIVSSIQPHSIPSTEVFIDYSGLID